MTRRSSRVLWLFLFVFGLTAGVFLLARALDNTISFYYTPSQLNTAQTHINIHLGGLVQEGSVISHKDGSISFVVTDDITTQNVAYRGALPSLFRAGQGVVAVGDLKDEVFVATRLLAKHDENYRPPAESDKK